MTEKNEQNELHVSDLFWKGYDVNIRDAHEIVVEVYRESKKDENREVPVTYMGVRIYEDGVLKEEHVLHGYENYGLFSYASAHKKATWMKLAIAIADGIAGVLAFGHEMYDFKVKKRLRSEKHIFLLDIPSEYTVDMPEAPEQFAKRLEIEMKEYELFRKKAVNPALDIREERIKLENELADYLNELRKK